jgi:flagellar protein FliS
MMNPYFEQTVMNAEPVELVRMLIQKALLCVREAREHLRRGRIAERALRIGDAYACLAELHRSLKPEVAPALVARLQGLYLYMMRRLMEANLGQVDPPLAEVFGLLTTLAEGWTGVVDQLAARHEELPAWVTSSRGEPAYREAVMA